MSFKSELSKITIVALALDFLLVNETDFTVLIYEYLFGETLLSLVLAEGYKILFPLQHFRVFDELLLILSP